MQLDTQEIDYIINLLEDKKYNIKVAIRKVLDNPHQYIDDVTELKERIVFIDWIIAKLQSMR